MDASLRKRLMALSDKSETLWKKESMQERINELAAYHDSGSGREDDEKQAGVVHVNKVMPNVRGGRANLFAKRPEILTKGRRVQDENAAKNAELFLNYCVRFLKQPAEIRDCLFWARLSPFGVVKLGMVEQGGMYLPTFRSVDPRSYRPDPMLEIFRPEEGAWEKYKMRRSLADLRRNKIYLESELDALRDKINAGGGEELHDEVIQIHLSEHYYRDAGGFRVSTFASGYDETGFNAEDAICVRDEEFTKVVGLPGRVLSFNISPREKRFFPNSPVEFWLEQQKEIDGYRTQKLLHAERANAKMLVDPTMFTPLEMQGLESREPRQYVPASNAGGKLDKAAVPIKFDTVNTDVWAGEDEAARTIEEVSGMDAVSMGNTQAERGSVSATRDQRVENAMRLRSSDDQEIFEDWMESTFQGTLNLGQKFVKGDVWIRITGQQEVKIEAKDIAGNIEVIMAFASTMPKDEESEWQKAVEFYTLISTNPLANQTRNLTELIKARKIRGGAEGWLAPQMPMATPGATGLPPEATAGGGFDASLLNELAMGGMNGGQSLLGQAAIMRNQT